MIVDWAELGTIAYLVVGLAFGALLWAAMTGDITPLSCDNPDCQIHHNAEQDAAREDARRMVESVRLGLNSPRRAGVALWLTSLIVMVVAAWPITPIPILVLGRGTATSKK